ncbi:hypothetical protein ABVC71_06550 [Prevotella amnii]|uniref:hypothetical protein n=1 Tax=Prevotella amnii TaxID=419005 RepID=UPI00336ADD54
MKHILILILFFSLSALSSCDDMSDEPKANTHELVFDAKGGEQSVQIIIKRITWRFERLDIYPLLHTERIEDYDKDGSIKREKVQISNLSDGTQSIHYDWITFIVSKDKRHIRVLVEKNDTKKVRGIEFIGLGQKICNASFKVFQSAE